jgi:hypothetical protein
VAPTVGSGGSLESGCRISDGAFERNLPSVAMNTFLHLTYFMTKYYKRCTLNAICLDSAAIDCSYFSTKKRSILIDFEPGYRSKHGVLLMEKMNAEGNVQHQSLVKLNYNDV